MKRLNNKGFAITTIVYGLAIMSTMILTLVMSLLATTRRDNSNLANEIEAELNRFSKTSISFEPSDAGQEFIVPEGEAGWYRIELWGAQGGGKNGGFGAYTSGIIKLEEGDLLYFVVGKQGTDSTGGGATDVRIENTDTVSSIETRIMVAAGGGKAAEAAGGTLVGYNETMIAPGGKIKVKDGYGLEANTTLMGFQTSGATTSFGTSPVTQTGTPGGHPSTTNPGGEGYFTSTDENYGGVSFISGYAGSKAYVKGTLIQNAKYTYHKKTGANYATEGRSYYFVDGIMYPGVNEGAGKAKIEKLVSSEEITDLPRANTNLNKVRYVRDCIGTGNANQTINSIAVSVKGDTKTGPLSTATKSGYVCKVLDLSAVFSVDEVAVYHQAGFDYQNHTIEVSEDNSTWVTIKGEGSGYNISETETATGVHISAYQPDYTRTVPESGNYYILPVTDEGKVLAAWPKSDDKSNPLKITSLTGESTQKWSIERLNEKISIAGVTEYRIVELIRYNALTIYRDENMEGNQLIVTTFNNLARNEPSIWKVTPMGDGTVTITSSAPTFTSSKATGNIYAQTNSNIGDTKNQLLIGVNNNTTQRFKLIKLDY